MVNLEKLDKLSYTSLLQYDTFSERLASIQLFDFNYQPPSEYAQDFYHSKEWKDMRERIIIRDRGMDLGCRGVPIDGPILVHHINPLVLEDYVNFNREKLLNPDNLISVSKATHNLIHYGSVAEVLPERRPGDTKLW